MAQSPMQILEEIRERLGDLAQKIAERTAEKDAGQAQIKSESLDADGVMRIEMTVTVKDETASGGSAAGRGGSGDSGLTSMDSRRAKNFAAAQKKVPVKTAVEEKRQKSYEAAGDSGAARRRSGMDALAKARAKTAAQQAKKAEAEARRMASASERSENRLHAKVFALDSQAKKAKADAAARSRRGSEGAFAAAQVARGAAGLGVPGADKLSGMLASVGQMVHGMERLQALFGGASSRAEAGAQGAAVPHSMPGPSYATPITSGGGTTPTPTPRLPTPTPTPPTPTPRLPTPTPPTPLPPPTRTRPRTSVRRVPAPATTLRAVPVPTTLRAVPVPKALAAATAPAKLGAGTGPTLRKTQVAELPKPPPTSLPKGAKASSSDQADDLAQVSAELAKITKVFGKMAELMAPAASKSAKDSPGGGGKSQPTAVQETDGKAMEAFLLQVAMKAATVLLVSGS